MAGPILLDTSFVYPDNKYEPVRDWGNGGGYNFIPGNYVGIPVFTSHQMSTVMGRLNTSISYTVAFTNAILKPDGQGTENYLPMLLSSTNFH